MKIKGVLAIGAVCCAAGLGLGFSAFADPKGDGKAAHPMGDMDMSKMMEVCEHFSKPTDQHKIIKEFAGTWDCEVKFWMDPSQPPNTTKGTMNVKLINGDKYAMGDFKGDMEMPGPDGKMMKHAFTGVSLLAYNTVDKRYESTWCDSMSTAIMMSKGQASADGKSIDSSAEFNMPVTMDGQVMPVKQREKMTMVSKDKYTMEMWHSMAGHESKVMEITYNRKK